MTTYEYDAFLSYRRRDSTRLAQWIRNKLQRFRLPPEILQGLARDKQELHDRGPRIWLDTSYEKANDDFLIKKIFPALDRSERLIVVCTPSALERLSSRDGKAQDNWLVREVDHFLGSALADSSGRPIDLIFGPGAIDGNYPGRLSEKPRWDWIDFRSFNQWRARIFSESLDAGFTKLVASLYDVPDRFLPALRREERRRRNRKIIGAAIGAIFVAALTSALAIWGLIEREDAIANADRAYAELRREVALRLVAEGQATLSGARADGDERALMKLLAAYRIAPEREVSGGILAAIISRSDLYKLIPTGSPITSIAVSADAKRVATGDQNGVVRIWDMRSGLPIGQPLQAGRGYITSVAFSPNGTRIAAGGSDRMLHLWDSETGQLIAAHSQAHANYVAGATFSPDGTNFATVGGDELLRVWDALTGTAIKKSVIAPDARGTNLAFSPADDCLIVGLTDGTLMILDTDRFVGKPLIRNEDFSSVAFSPDGRLIASGGGGLTYQQNDNSVRVWNSKTGEALAVAVGHEAAVTKLAFSPDSQRIVSSSLDGTVRVWDSKTGRQVGSPLPGHRGPVRGVAFSADGALIASGGDDSVLRIWKGNPGRPIGISRNVGAVIRAVAVSPNDTAIVSNGKDNSLQLWSLATGKPLGAAFNGHNGEVSTVAFSPSGKQIVSGGADGIVQFWNVTTNQSAPILPPLSNERVRSVAYSPDGLRAVSAGDDNALHIWDAASAQAVGIPLEGHTDSVTAVVFSPDGKMIVSGSEDATARLWDAEKGIPVGPPFKGEPYAIWSVAFHPSGRQFVSGDVNGNLSLWEVMTGRTIGKPIHGHLAAVTSVDFSPSGSEIASGSMDRTLRIWEADTGLPIGPPLAGHTNTIWSVKFSPDGRSIVSGGADGTLHIWPAPIAWPDELCAKLVRDMTAEEWVEWISKEIPYVHACSIAKGTFDRAD